jgi:hypothetical protein
LPETPLPLASTIPVYSAPGGSKKVSRQPPDGVEADTRARHRSEKPIADARLRLIRELEKVAYSDVRDLVGWDREPILDADGTVTGYRDRMTVTPSHRLKPGVDAASAAATTNVQVNQVNIGSDNALEAVRRLAFAIQKAQHSQLLTEPAVASHPVGANAKV